MITHRLFPDNEQELLEIASRTLEGCSSVAVQAGHFLLYYDRTEDLLLPAIGTELTAPRHEVIRRQVGNYPILSWNMGLELLDSLPRVSRRAILVAVNDWQYLPKDISLKRFYDRASKLPMVFAQGLQERYGKIVHLRPKSKEGATSRRPFFSETALRRAYEHQVRTRRGESHLTPGIEGKGAAEPRDQDDETQKIAGAYCSVRGTNCSHEVAELVRQVGSDHHFEAQVNFAPLSCMSDFETGTEIGWKIFRNVPRVVVNIFMPTFEVTTQSDLFDGAEIVIHRFP